MENSSKALLIAASVLITIVLISVGINLLSSTSGVTEEVGSVSDSMAVSVFNSQFTSYLGNSVSGTQAKLLVEKIITNNHTSSHKILTWAPQKTTDHTDPQVLYNWLNKTSTYNIYINTGCGQGARNGYHTNGFICCIRFDKIS